MIIKIENFILTNYCVLKSLGACMKIKLAGLSDGEHNYDFENNAFEIGLGSDFNTSIFTNVTLQKNVRQYFLNIECHTTKISSCDRCLENFDLHIDCSFKMVYSYDDSFSIPDFDEVKFLKLHETEIDISDDVRQMILLNIPMKLLCSENCKGLCPRCGHNLNESDCNCDKESFNSIFNELKKLKF